MIPPPGVFSPPAGHRALVVFLDDLFPRWRESFLEGSNDLLGETYTQHHHHTQNTDSWCHTTIHMHTVLCDQNKFLFVVHVYINKLLSKYNHYNKENHTSVVQLFC